MTRHSITSAIVFIGVVALALIPAGLIVFFLLLWFPYLNMETERGYAVLLVLTAIFCIGPAFLLARRVYRDLDPNWQPEILPFQARMRRFFQRIGVGIAVCSAVAVLAFSWSLANPYIVKARAAALAGDVPYCVQVRFGKYHYKPVEIWSELTGFALQTPWVVGGSDDYQFTFHAVLVISSGYTSKLYNWSYRFQNFLPISSSTQSMLYLPVVCTPALDFLDNLPEHLT